MQRTLTCICLCITQSASAKEEQWPTIKNGQFLIRDCNKKEKQEMLERLKNTTDGNVHNAFAGGEVLDITIAKLEKIDKFGQSHWTAVVNHVYQGNSKLNSIIHLASPVKKKAGINLKPKNKYRILVIDGKAFGGKRKTFWVTCVALKL
ncbi:MAG: hypothetical protein NW224_17755 [Leptolyngbyaceae cyanobacterium bins.302]|nr:hypothetical protein [Leptolyngbyaceae cyanobacterium bins.302]